jgi:hypothetical protein
MDFVQIAWHNFSIRLGKLLREKFRHAERGRSGGETESHRYQTKYSSSAVRYQESAACSLLKETLRKTLQYLFKTEPLLVTFLEARFLGNNLSEASPQICTENHKFTTVASKEPKSNAPFRHVSLQGLSNDSQPLHDTSTWLSA